MIILSDLEFRPFLPLLERSKVTQWYEGQGQVRLLEQSLFPLLNHRGSYYSLRTGQVYMVYTQLSDSIYATCVCLQDILVIALPIQKFFFLTQNGGKLI